MPYGGYSSRVSSLIQQQGQDAANLRLQKGANLASLIQGVGNIAAAVPGQIVEGQKVAKAKEQVELAHSLAEQFKRPDGTTDFGKVVQGLRQAKAFEMADGVEKQWRDQQVADSQMARDSAAKKKSESDVVLATNADTRAAAEAQRKADEAAATAGRLKAVEVILTKHADPATKKISDWAPVIEEVRAVDPKAADELLKNWKESQSFATESTAQAVKSAASQLSRYTTAANYKALRDALPENVRKQFPEVPTNRRDILKIGLAPKEIIDVDIDQQRANQANQPSQGSKIWVNRAGKLIRISEGEYQPGDLPANSREQGRPVTSGDAGDIGGMDEALLLADQLGTELGAGSTGIGAWLGSITPDAVTNLTGFGLEPKKRGALIGQVKQIIGKGLEGGVLRLEDEKKYEKMLPTMSDPPEVVKEKIRLMMRTLNQKRETRINALEDANYDVSKFRVRVQDPNNGKPKMTAAELIKKYGGG